MEKKTKYIMLGLGVVALGTGAYVYYLQKKKKKEIILELKLVHTLM